MATLTQTPGKASILFTRRRRDFRREDLILGDKDSHESYTEIIRFADAKADEKKLMIDFSCDIPQRCDVAVGPDPVYYTNFGVQTKEIDAPQDEKDRIFSSSSMKDFLEDAESLMGPALIQNSLCNVFVDDFSHFPPDDSAIGGKGDKTLKILSAYENFHLTKNKIASKVEIQPAAIGKSTTDREKVGLLLEVLSSSMSFEQRIKGENVLSKTNVLIWNPPDPAPIIALESPAEITCAHFHPFRSNIIIAGTTTGRVLAYDLTSAFEELKTQRGVKLQGVREKKDAAKKEAAKEEKKEEKQQSGSSGSGGTALLAAIAQLSSGDTSFSFRNERRPADGESGPDGLPLHTAIKAELEDLNEQNGMVFVQPLRVSSMENGRVKEREIEGSHTREVSELIWISPSTFLSISTDGKMKMWDIYATLKTLGVFLASFSSFTIDTPPPFTYLAFNSITSFQFETKTEKEKKRAAEKASSSSSASSSTPSISHSALLRLDSTTDYPALPTEVWFPLFTSAAFSMDGMATESLLSLSSVNASTVLIGTERGEMIRRDIFDRQTSASARFSSDTTTSTSGGSGGEGGESESSSSSASSSSSSSSYAGLLDAVPVGCFPLRFLQRNPFVESLTLAVSGGEFAVWKDGLDQPLIVSPPSTHHITACCWSPTRASVVLLARQGGSVEVWCVIERVTDPVLTHTFSPHTVISLSVSHPLPLTLGGSVRDPQFLCLGDDSGRITIAELPLSLSAPSRTERKLFELFVEHESTRILQSRKKEEEEKEKNRLIAEKKMLGEKGIPVAAAPAHKDTHSKRGSQYFGEEDEEGDAGDGEKLPPKPRDAQGQFIYDMEDYVIWETLGNIDEATLPPLIQIEFHQDIDTPEEAQAKEKAKQEKSTAKPRS